MSSASGAVRRVDKSTVRQICSHQVVIDLKGCVKELVENSLDAGSTDIEVRLVDSGLDTIEVKDNGCGIAPNNYESIVAPHSTSKIRAFEDIHSKLSTLGFRGEALSALCTMSDLRVCTRRAEDNTGVMLQYDKDCNLINQTIQAREVGTTVCVSQLFHGLPVRHREFQKTIKQQLAAMLSLLQAYAIRQGNCRFTCTNETPRERRKTSTLLATSGRSSSLRSGASTVLGYKVTNDLVDFEIAHAGGGAADSSQAGGSSHTNNRTAHPPWKCVGLVSAAQKGRRTHDIQFFFVNGRPVDTPKRIARCLNDVYRQSTCKSWPAYVLDFQIDNDAVDVNVTPDKRTILLQNEQAIADALGAGYERILQPSASSYEASSLAGGAAPPSIRDYFKSQQPRQERPLPPQKQEPMVLDDGDHNMGEQQGPGEPPPAAPDAGVAGEAAHDMGAEAGQHQEDDSATEEEKSDQDVGPSPPRVSDRSAKAPPPRAARRPPSDMMQSAGWQKRVKVEEGEEEGHGEERSEADPRSENRHGRRGPPSAPQQSASAMGDRPVGGSAADASLPMSQVSEDRDDQRHVRVSSPSLAVRRRVHQRGNAMLTEFTLQAPSDGVSAARSFRVSEWAPSSSGGGSREQSGAPLVSVKEEGCCGDDGDELRASSVKTVVGNSGQQVKVTTFEPSPTVPCHPKPHPSVAAAAAVAGVGVGGYIEDADIDMGEGPAAATSSASGAMGRKRRKAGSQEVPVAGLEQQRGGKGGRGVWAPDGDIEIVEGDADLDMAIAEGAGGAGDEGAGEGQGSDGGGRRDAMEVEARPPTNGDSQNCLGVDLSQLRDRWRRRCGGDTHVDGATACPGGIQPQDDGGSADASSMSFPAAFSLSSRCEPQSIAAVESSTIKFDKDWFTKMRVCGQFNMGFIIASLPDAHTHAHAHPTHQPPNSSHSGGEGEGGDTTQSLFIIDQHASDEKARFEHLNQHSSIQSQPLIHPLQLHLTPAQEQVVEDHLEVFRMNGFGVSFDPDQVAGRRVLVRSIPHTHNKALGEEDFIALVHQLYEHPWKPPKHNDTTAPTGGAGSRDTWGTLLAGVPRPKRVWDVLASKACRSAVMIGKGLNVYEMSQLVSRMSTLQQPWNCPHGRPTMRHLIHTTGATTAQDHHHIAPADDQGHADQRFIGRVFV